LAYKGTNYHGWQLQPDAVTIQETLSKSLSTLLKSTIEIVGAGRTDTGVHAKEMFAHFDFDQEFVPTILVQKLNSYLPKDIVIYSILKVHDEAHARFDATKRTYEYHIHTYKNAFETENSWFYSQLLDTDKMNQACNILFRHTDFECFSKTNTDVRTFNCTIFDAKWEVFNERIIFTISADRFLRNMVRAIVGTMINIGIGKTSLEDFEAIIKSKDRNKAGFSVPAHGLYLTRIHYEYLQ
jgi:tRNA pseudouridine38-40 synthase